LTKIFQNRKAVRDLNLILFFNYLIVYLLETFTLSVYLQNVSP